MLAIDRNVPIISTRGRPASEEHVTLLNMPFGASFVSHKSRDALYWLGRKLGRQMNFRITVMSEGRNPDGSHRGWRVWKLHRKDPGFRHVEMRKAVPHPKGIDRRRKTVRAAAA